MTKEEKLSSVDRANDEKKRHPMYPDYPKRRGRTVDKNTSGPKSKTSTAPSNTCACSESTFPEIHFAASRRIPRTAVQRAAERFR